MRAALRGRTLTIRSGRGHRVYHRRHLSNAILDVRGERALRALPVASERAFEKDAVLIRCDGTAKDRSDHLVPKILVAYRSVRLDQHA